MTSFGNRLRELRLKNKITQRDLSKKLKMSESAIGMYERGEREPSFEIVLKIANTFDVSTDYLMGLTHKELQQEVDFKKALKALKERKARWGSDTLSNPEQETLEKILDAVIQRDKTD
jgi:transcriptional regulator with XRE-family HTH domain